MSAWQTSTGRLVAVTSFPAYDALGALADRPDQAADVMVRMARVLLD